LTKVIQVAVAVMTKPNGEYLLASRPDGKGWAGWWEFPGGKVEKDEAPEAALSRELQEELGVTPTKIQAWIKRRYDYPATKDDVAKTVLLHFYFVLAWEGEPAPLEGQTLAWQHPQKRNVSPVLPANAPIMHALSLPNHYMVTAEPPQMAADELTQFANQMHALAIQHEARVLVHADIALVQTMQVDGVHLSSQALMQLKVKPAGLLVAASCHGLDELVHAQSLALDFVTVTPPSSADAGYDWVAFAEMVSSMTIPVYADVHHADDLALAQAVGARGIAIPLDAKCV